MLRLLIIADDFTGALDTGVQFASKGAVTQISVERNFDSSAFPEELEVLVLDAETRHCTGQDAYRRVFEIARAAKEAGVPFLYKKTDSALRGNIGSELTALMDGAGRKTLPFLPAFPQMDRTTKGGIHYIGGVPVAQSVFGKDPFEPVRHSRILDILREQTDVPVVLHPQPESMTGVGIQVYDALSQKDLETAAGVLGKGNLHICAGCAGFASALADILGICGAPVPMPHLRNPLLVICGSVNPVTVRQLETAVQAGYPRISLSPESKLGNTSHEAIIEHCLDALQQHDCVMLDANDPPGSTATMDYAADHGITTEQLRLKISFTLGRLAQGLLDRDLDATLLCTGGDTLLALLGCVGVTELTPVCEAAPGTVLSYFQYHEKTYHILSKSGGFGQPELIPVLLSQFQNG